MYINLNFLNKIYSDTSPYLYVLLEYEDKGFLLSKFYGFEELEKTKQKFLEILNIIEKEENLNNVLVEQITPLLEYKIYFGKYSKNRIKMMGKTKVWCVLANHFLNGKLLVISSAVKIDNFDNIPRYYDSEVKVNGLINKEKHFYLNMN